MDTYKITVECRKVEASDRDVDYMTTFIEDTLAHIVDVAHQHGLDLLSVYLIKATNCAPSEGEN